MGNPPDDGPCEVTITAPDPEWLQQFVRHLVEDRLAAAAHVDIMRTTYRWAGTINVTFEAKAILHTRATRIAEVNERIDAQHPYDVACVAATHFSWVSPKYGDWIMTETSL